MASTTVATTTEVTDAAALAAVAQAALEQQQQQKVRTRPPKPLPAGWFRKESRTQPNHYYYFQAETGICTWTEPQLNNPNIDSSTNDDDAAGADDENNGSDDTGSDSNTREKKRPAESSGDTSSSKRQKSKPSKVRIFHILKKHKDSRRPSSWREKKITISEEEARAALQEFLEVLQESTSPEELRATFEEIARTESDCSSAKRGGDLGFFGPKKMQPAFEKASFDLEIGELSEIVETNSGVHVLLRIG